eukprot:scaffold255339_cov36-Tisochrysis_lutea.AAC.2
MPATALPFSEAAFAPTRIGCGDAIAGNREGVRWLMGQRGANGRALCTLRFEALRAPRENGGIERLASDQEVHGPWAVSRSATGVRELPSPPQGTPRAQDLRCEGTGGGERDKWWLRTGSRE